MQVTDTIIAAIVGFLSAVITSLIASRVSYRKLKTEYLAQHRKEIIDKQVSACESLWIALEPASRVDGETRIVVNVHDSPRVILPVAIEFNRKITEVFFSPSGLYFSRQLRRALFGLRDFIQEEFISKNLGKEIEFDISKTKYRKFRSKMTKLIITIREEIGVEDLCLAREGPAEGI
ncbi:MAG: hypothetical protein K8R89_06330 [Anaerolineae bacterium]|nr:hypothetical protein [Anaerolineae bacterium]